MEILSYGGGVQTVATAILNVTGRISPRAEFAVFADPGAEMPGTYAHLEIMRPWLAKRGLPLIVTRNEVDGPLEEYVLNRSTVIPVHIRKSGDTGDGLSRRQCTSKWKIEVVERWLRAQGAETATVQLGISLDEFHRVKPSKTKWVTNRHPLIELRLTRAQCRKVIMDAGLPVPPPSKCFFCPFHRQASWQNLAVYEPELFERAIVIENAIQERHDLDTGTPYLSSAKKPLRKKYGGKQLPMDLPEDDDQCGGYCMV